MTYSDYLLSPDDVERFNVTFAGNPSMSEMLEDSAATWRDKLRPAHHTMKACRWAFLCMIVVRAESEIPLHARMEDLPTLARYLCMRVEQRVEELDGTRNSLQKCLNQSRPRD